MSATDWFDNLIQECLPALLRTARYLCDGRRADAEDLVQDTVLRALRAQDQIQHSAAARTWLFRVLTRTHLNRTRTTRRRAESFSADMDDNAFEEALAAWTPLTDPEAAAIERIDHTFLASAIAALPSGHRAVLLLADVEGFTQREVAELVGIAEGTVASRLYRARRAVRSRLQTLNNDQRPQEAV